MEIEMEMDDDARIVRNGGLKSTLAIVSYTLWVWNGNEVWFRHFLKENVAPPYNRLGDNEDD